jgi:hypothetical protein
VGDVVELAAQLSRETTVMIKEIAQRLDLGSWKSVATRLHSLKRKNQSLGTISLLQFDPSHPAQPASAPANPATNIASASFRETNRFDRFIAGKKTASWPGCQGKSPESGCRRFGRCQGFNNR